MANLPWMSDERDERKLPDNDPEKSRFRFPRNGGFILFLALLLVISFEIFSNRGDDTSQFTYNQFLALMSDTSLHVRKLSLVQGTRRNRGFRTARSHRRRAQGLHVSSILVARPRGEVLHRATAGCRRFDSPLVGLLEAHRSPRRRTRKRLARHSSSRSRPSSSSSSSGS